MIGIKSWCQCRVVAIERLPVHHNSADYTSFLLRSLGPLWYISKWSSAHVYARGRKQCCILHYYRDSHFVIHSVFFVSKRQSFWRLLYSPCCKLISDSERFKFNLNHAQGNFDRQQFDDFFSENRVWHFMQTVSLGNNLHEMSTHVFLKKSEKYFEMSVDFFLWLCNWHV